MCISIIFFHPRDSFFPRRIRLCGRGDKDAIFRTESGKVLEAIYRWYCSYSLFQKGILGEGIRKSLMSHFDDFFAV